MDLGYSFLFILHDIVHRVTRAYCNIYIGRHSNLLSWPLKLIAVYAYQVPDIYVDFNTVTYLDLQWAFETHCLQPDGGKVMPGHLPRAIFYRLSVFVKARDVDFFVPPVFVSDIINTHVIGIYSSGNNGKCIWHVTPGIYVPCWYPARGADTK